MRLPAILSLAVVATSVSSSARAPLSSGGGGGGGGVVTNVVIKDFVFTPFTVTVWVGATVRWTNDGAVAHTTTSDVGAWDSGTLSPPAAGSTTLRRYATAFRYSSL